MREKEPGQAIAAASLRFVLSLITLAMFGPALRAVTQERPSRPAETVRGVLAPEEIERRIFEAVNKERSARNLPAVKLSAALTDLARKQSRDLAGLGRLGHTSVSGRSYSERLEDAGVLFAASGENVARSDSFQPDPIHESLMTSGGHRENILHPDFDEAGVGVFRGSDGVYYVTQDFIKSVVVRDEAEARAFILSALDKARLSQGLSPLVPVGDVHRTAQAFALTKSQGQTLPVIPPEYGETRVNFYNGPDLDRIGAAMNEESLARYQLTGVGVHFVRTPEYPGGTYYVCTFLLAGDPALLWDEEERVQEVLKTLNEIRFSRNKIPLVLDPGLSRTAADLGARFRSGATNIDVPGTRAVAVFYETPKLDRLTDKLRARLANMTFRRVGISARPIDTGTGLNVNFLVVLLLDD